MNDYFEGNSRQIAVTRPDKSSMKPCPRCKGRPKMREFKTPSGVVSYGVTCIDCLLGAHIKPTPEEAIKKWNRRWLRPQTELSKAREWRAEYYSLPEGHPGKEKALRLWRYHFARSPQKKGTDWK